MSWIELSITTHANKATELSEHLISLGADAVTFQDAGNQPIFEPTPETPRLWHDTKVMGLFDSNHPILKDIIAEISSTSRGLSAGSRKKIKAFISLDPADKPRDVDLNCHLKYIPDEDWERRCLDSFKPIRCGKRLWICPSWHSPPEPGAVNVILDPGLAFGTGTHPTTALCLEWLDNHITSEKLIIDYGCGSGILSIAALKLGAQKVFAIDNDRQALEATRLNAERNQLNFNELITQLPNAPLNQSADILIANILAQPIMQLAPHFAELTRSGSKIVLSGILKDQVDQIITLYKRWFNMKNPVYMAEWARLEGERHTKL